MSIRKQRAVFLVAVSLLVQVLARGNAARTVATSQLREGGALRSRGHFQQNAPRDDPGVSARIHDGNLASPGQFKATVFIKVKYDAVNTLSDEGTTEVGECTGTIIGTYWVLTAAHCVPTQHLYNQYYCKGTFKNCKELRYTIETDFYHVYAGCLNRFGRDCIVREVNNYFLPDGAVSYLDEDRNDFVIGRDIALLSINNQFYFNEKVGPSALMAAGRMPYTLDSCVAQGFGIQLQEEDGYKHDDGKLRYVNITAGNTDFCRLFSPNFPFLDFHVCIHNYEDESRMTCDGDSGASLLCKAVDGDVISVAVLSESTSNGPCGATDAVNMYVAVGSFQEWIKKITKDPNIVFKKLK